MRRIRLLGTAFTAFTAITVFFAGERNSAACGASPGGPVGHMMCGPDDGPLEHRYRGAVSYSFANTRISFGDGLKHDLNRHLVMATFDYRLDKKKALTIGAGGLLVGNLRNGQNYVMESGPALMVGYSLGFLKEEKNVPFGVFTVVGSFVHTATRPVGPLSLRQGSSGYTALDARVGVMVGKTFFDRLSVYAAGRLFGGPVFWRIADEAKLGTDIYHYQLGGGLIVQLPAGLSLYGEGIAVGERGAVAGLSITP